MMRQVCSSKVEVSMSTADKFPNWFDAYAKPNFEKYLIPLAGVDNLTFLQLGAYTGDASLWLLDNVLTGANSILIDVDTWQGSDEEVHHSMDFSEVESVYDAKIRGKASKNKMTTVDYLLRNSFEYDFVYVDADHTAASALIDGELAWQYLKPNGILAFDDYQWGAELPASKSPKLGIDLFLERHLGEYEILEQGLQVWIRKL
jgi:predicted O-methyltransferase YrrM